MRRLMTVVTCCAATLAVCCTVAVGTSSAVPMWHIGITCENDPNNTGHWEGQVLAFCVFFKFTPIFKYKYKFVNNANNLTVPDKFTESFTDLGIGTTVSCSGSGEGKVGPEAADLQTKLTVSECKTVKGTCGSPMAEAIRLPWKTELYAPGSEEVRDKIMSGGAGNPAWKVTCIVLGIKVVDTCEGESNTNAINGEGIVEEIFDSKTPKANCSMGGAGSGVIEGTEKVGPASSTEALFVE